MAPNNDIKLQRMRRAIMLAYALLAASTVVAIWMIDLESSSRQAAQNDIGREQQRLDRAIIYESQARLNQHDEQLTRLKAVVARLSDINARQAKLIATLRAKFPGEFDHIILTGSVTPVTPVTPDTPAPSRHQPSQGRPQTPPPPPATPPASPPAGPGKPPKKTKKDNPSHPPAPAPTPPLPPVVPQCALTVCRPDVSLP